MYSEEDDPEEYDLSESTAFPLELLQARETLEEKLPG